MKKMNTRMWILMGLMAAISVILTRFLSIQPTNALRFSLGYVPIILTGIWLGLIPAIFVGLVADILGTVLFSSYGWIPALTLAPVMVGAYSGFMAKYYLKNKFVLSLLIAFLINFLVRGLFTSYLFTIVYGYEFFITLIWRTVQCVVLTVAETIVIYFLLKSPVSQIWAGQRNAGR